MSALFAIPKEVVDIIEVLIVIAAWFDVPTHMQDVYHGIGSVQPE